MVKKAKRNKTKVSVNTYPSPNKATSKLVSKNNSKLNTRVLQKIKDQKNLDPSDTSKQNTQSELTAKLSDPELSGALLNSVSSSFNNEQEGGVTAVVAKARYHRATENQPKQRFEHPARSRPSNTVIKVLLDSGSDGDLMFHEKGTPKHFPYLARQVPNSWHTSNGSFLTKGRSKVSLKFFEYSNSKEFLVTPDVVEYDRKKMAKPMYDLILGCKP